MCCETKDQRNAYSYDWLINLFYTFNNTVGLRVLKSHAVHKKEVIQVGNRGRDGRVRQMFNP